MLCCCVLYIFIYMSKRNRISMETIRPLTFMCPRSLHHPFHPLSFHLLLSISCMYAIQLLLYLIPFLTFICLILNVYIIDFYRCENSTRRQRMVLSSDWISLLNENDRFTGLLFFVRVLYWTKPIYSKWAIEMSHFILSFIYCLNEIAGAKNIM